MVIKLEEAYPLLRCPGTGATLRRVGDKEIEADGHSGRRYAIKEGVPILVDFKESILDETAIRKSLDSTLPRRDNGKMVRAIKALLFSSNRVAKRNVQEQTRLLKEKSCKPALLVVGGGMVGAGLEELYQDQDVRIIAFDIYASCYVQFVADAHAIPLADASVDGVIVQAVLEACPGTLDSCEGDLARLKRRRAGLRRDSLHAASSRGALRFHPLYRERASLPLSTVFVYTFRLCSRSGDAVDLGALVFFPGVVSLQISGARDAGGVLLAPSIRLRHSRAIFRRRGVGCFFSWEKKSRRDAPERDCGLLPRGELNLPSGVS